VISVCQEEKEDTKILYNVSQTLLKLDLLERLKINCYLLRSKSKEEKEKQKKREKERKEAKQKKPTKKHMEILLHSSHKWAPAFEIFFPNPSTPPNSFLKHSKW
jgi:hypothetical protein